MPVVLFNQEIIKLTHTAIKTIKIGLPQSSEFILIDNGSPIKPSMFKKEVDLIITNRHNPGYAVSVNQGFKKAKGQYICVANNDIRVPASWWGVAYSIFTNPDYTKRWKIGSVHFRMIPYDQPMEFGSHDYPEGKERWCTSSFFVIRKSALPKDGYDEYYTYGGVEDWDLWHRVRHVNGWKTIYTTRSCYQHKDSYTAGRMDQAVREECAVKGREHFKDKFGKLPEEVWWELYPDQMMKNWRQEFNEL